MKRGESKKLSITAGRNYDFCKCAWNDSGKCDGHCNLAEIL